MLIYIQDLQRSLSENESQKSFQIWIVRYIYISLKTRMILPTMYDAVRHASLPSQRHRQQKVSSQRYVPNECDSGILKQSQVANKDPLLNCISKDSQRDLKSINLEKRDVSSVIQIKGCSDNDMTQCNEQNNGLRIAQFEDSIHKSVSSGTRSNTKRMARFLFPNSDESHYSSTSYGSTIYQYSVGISADPKSEGHDDWKTDESSSWQSSRRLWKVSDFTAVPEMPPVLGSGKFGKVKLCRTRISGTMKHGSNHHDGNVPETWLAVKILKKSSNQNKLLWRREVEIQTRLSHPNILHCYGYFQCSSNIYIVLDYCSERDLAKYSKQHTISMQACRNVIYQVTSALNYLQKRNVAHRDVKLENILMDTSGVIKLADFGYAVYCPLSDLRTTFCGTLPCLPPELLRCSRAPYHALCVDAWSLGILTYELIQNKPLWMDSDPERIKDEIRGFSEAQLRKHLKEMNDQENADVTSWSNFVMSLLRRNPKSRMMLHQSLSHTWLFKSETLEATKRKCYEDTMSLEEKHGYIRPKKYFI
jgi:Protein kinase domain